MRYLANISGLILCAAVIMLFWAETAQAYIDPSSGSYFLQILLAGLLGALFTLKIYWRKIKAFFSGKDADHDAGQ
ncbi:MAG: hypothetical protein JW763_06240 [candidate division Zixibacteria bacterium]|nr:hypothetical protein [candidate division Zixibacteria bacterium]